MDFFFFYICYLAKCSFHTCGKLWMLNHNRNSPYIIHFSKQNALEAGSGCFTIKTCKFMTYTQFLGWLSLRTATNSIGFCYHLYFAFCETFTIICSLNNCWKLLFFHLYFCVISDDILYFLPHSPILIYSQQNSPGRNLTSSATSFECSLTSRLESMQKSPGKLLCL